MPKENKLGFWLSGFSGRCKLLLLHFMSGMISLRPQTKLRTYIHTFIQLVYLIRRQPSAKWSSKGSIEDLCFVMCFMGINEQDRYFEGKKEKFKSILHKEIQQFKVFFYDGWCTVWLKQCDFIFLSNLLLF